MHACLWFYFRPYNDGFLVAASILSVLALSISWVNRVSLGMSVLSLVLIRIIWCWKPTKNGVSASALVSLFAGVGCFYVGLRIMPSVDTNSGVSNNLFDDDDDDDDDDYHNVNQSNANNNTNAEIQTEISCTKGMLLCETTKLGSVFSFCSGILWFLTTWCIFRFLRSDRLARHEASNANFTNASDHNDDEREITENFPASKGVDIELTAFQ